MSPTEYEAFQPFASRHRRDLARIARATHGDYAEEDLPNEAWLLAHQLADQGPPINWSDAQDIDRLLRCLYNRLVKYQEKNTRHALRLDHAPAGCDGDHHPVADRLIARDGHDPLDVLIAAESAQDDHKLVERSHSLAAAYARLVRHFRNDVQAIAQYLLISPSWTYQRLQKVQALTERQLPIRFSPSCCKLPLPRPWRTFRLQRTPVQLAFDFPENSLLGG